jgi:beta-lactamase superfamily II metal-dependent hydrolase
MYRVGFGDCFLLSLPTDGGMEHVLIDCGVHNRGNIGTLDKVVENIGEETGKKLALVIASHAHQDHISGFASHAEEFRAFEVREVWLPWTENPDDKPAQALQRSYAALAENIALRFGAREGPEETRPAAEAALENLSGNEEALQTLRSGINGGRVVYVDADRQFTDVAGVRGLSARVLGPPRDPKDLAGLYVPVDERLLRVGSDSQEGSDDALTPFPCRWRVDASVTKHYAAITDTDKNLLAGAATNAEGMAFALDRALNNTSIVALLTFGGNSMLFAGDAQYGSWRSWLEKSAEIDPLSTVSFYKASHHGSFNATPKSALERMKERGFVTMVSTQSMPWDSIPFPRLMQALDARSSGVARSDAVPIDGAPTPPAGHVLPGCFQAGPFWIDCLLPLEGDGA